VGEISLPQLEHIGGVIVSTIAASFTLLLAANILYLKVIIFRITSILLGFINNYALITLS